MRRLLVIATITFLATGMVAAGARDARGAGHPHRYLPNSLDGAIVQIENPVDGRNWSAWSYRNGDEYDLALAVSTDPGLWSEPLLIGVDDGIDQREPALAVDPRGVLYVAYGDGDGAIRLIALQPGESGWSAPVTVVTSANRFLSSPELMVVANALIVGYREGDGVALHAMPLLPAEEALPENHVRSIYDGPDPTTGQDDREEEDSSASGDAPINAIGSNGGVTIRPVSESGRSRGD